MINRELRNYEVSLWTIQDDFMAVLKYADVEHKNQIQNPILTLDVDGTQSFNFSIPMYLYEGDTRVENSLWYDAYRGGLLLCGLRKIKVIINKGDKENEAIYEFLIMKVTENHQGGELTCDVECEGLAFQELGKTGYKVSLTSDDFYQDDLAWFENGGKYLDEQEISDFNDNETFTINFSAPTGVNGKWQVQNGIGKLTLSWNPVLSATGYNIYSGDAEDPFDTKEVPQWESTNYSATNSHRFGITAYREREFNNPKDSDALIIIPDYYQISYFEKNQQRFICYNDFNSNTVKLTIKSGETEIALGKDIENSEYAYDHVKAFSSNYNDITINVVIETPRSIVTIAPDLEVAKLTFGGTPQITKAQRQPNGRNIFVYWDAVAQAKGYYLELYQVPSSQEIVNQEYASSLIDWPLYATYRDTMTSANFPVDSGSDYLIRLRAYNDTYISQYSEIVYASAAGDIDFFTNQRNDFIYIQSVVRTRQDENGKYDDVELHWPALFMSDAITQPPSYNIFYRPYNTNIAFQYLKTTTNTTLSFINTDNFLATETYDFYISTSTIELNDKTAQIIEVSRIDTKITVKWEKVNGAAAYQLIDTTSDIRWEIINQPSDDDNNTFLTYTIPNANLSQTYSLQICTISTSTDETSQQLYSYSAPVVVPPRTNPITSSELDADTVIDILPSQGDDSDDIPWNEIKPAFYVSRSSNSQTIINVIWQKVESATAYHIYYKDSTKLQFTLVDKVGANVTHKKISGTNKNRKYTIRVQAFNYVKGGLTNYYDLVLDVGETQKATENWAQQETTNDQANAEVNTLTLTAEQDGQDNDDNTGEENPADQTIEFVPMSIELNRTDQQIEWKEVSSADGYDIYEQNSSNNWILKESILQRKPSDQQPSSSTYSAKISSDSTQILCVLAYKEDTKTSTKTAFSLSNMLIILPIDSEAQKHYSIITINNALLHVVYSADIVVMAPIYSVEKTGSLQWELKLYSTLSTCTYYYTSFDDRYGIDYICSSNLVTVKTNREKIAVRAAAISILTGKTIYSEYVTTILPTQINNIVYSKNIVPVAPNLVSAVIEDSTLKLDWESTGTGYGLKYAADVNMSIDDVQSLESLEDHATTIDEFGDIIYLTLQAKKTFKGQTIASPWSDIFVIHHMQSNNPIWEKYSSPAFMPFNIKREMTEITQDKKKVYADQITITPTLETLKSNSLYHIYYKATTEADSDWHSITGQGKTTILQDTGTSSETSDLSQHNLSFVGKALEIAVYGPAYDDKPLENLTPKSSNISTIDAVAPGGITTYSTKLDDSSSTITWQPAIGAERYYLTQSFRFNSTDHNDTSYTFSITPPKEGDKIKYTINNPFAVKCSIKIVPVCYSPLTRKTLYSDFPLLFSISKPEENQNALTSFSLMKPLVTKGLLSLDSSTVTDTATLQNRPKANLQYWCNKFLKPVPSDVSEMNPKEWYYEIKMDWATFSKREGGSARLSNIIYEDEYVSSWRIESNEAVPKDFQPCKEKERLVDLEESNKYNLTQDLAEKFGVYCKYQYLYDDTYHIIGRKIIFYNNFIEEDSGAMDITYKYNTTDLSRTIDSTDIVTKMYVRPVDNSYSLSGQATILDVGANLSHEDYLLNFDYLHDIGTIDDDLYNRIRPYEIEMCNYNQKIAPLQEALLELRTQLPQTQAQLQTAKNAVGLDTERITDAGALLNNLTNGSGIIHVTENNPDTAVILGGSSGYIKVSRKGIIPTTIQIYSTMNYASTGGNRLSGQISGGKMEYDEFGNLTKINGITGGTERRIVYLTYDYQPQLYYENIKRTWEQRLSKDQGDVGKLTTEVDSLEENISSLEERIDTLIAQKQEAINTFNRSMGSALREGYWQPNDYKDYGDRYVDNFSELLTVKDKNQGFYGNSVFIWDDQPFPEEQTTSYALTVEETNTYYYYIELTWDIINKYKDQMGFLYYDYAVDGSKVGDSDTIRFRRAKMLGSESVLGFINKNGKAVPVLILLGYEQLGTYEQQYAASYGAVGRLETTVASNNSSIIFREDSTPVRSLGGIKQFSDKQELIYPRIQFHSIALKTSEDQLNVRLDDTLLKNYEDFYILTRVDKKNSSSEDIGSDDFFTENFFLTIKPDKFAFGIAEQQQSNKTSVINVKYAFSNADTAIYLDAKEVLRDSSMPKVSYSVNVSLLQPVYMKRLAHLLNRIVHINDWELHFNNVQGYVSNVSLDLDHPWEDSIEIKNYRTKFEDLFTRIVASTESMKRAEFSTNIVSQVFNNEGEIHDASVVQSLIDSSALNYAFNNGQLTINEKDGIWGSSAEGVVAFRGGGIFTATEKDENGDWIWNSGILPKGINASLITAGQLDTNLINVYSGNNLRFQWNGDGLYAYKTPLYTNDSGVIIETVQDEYGRKIDIEQNLQNSTSLGLDTKQYVVMNEDGLFLTLEAGAPYMKGGKITAMQKTVDRVAISWDGLVLCNNNGERVFYADPDTGDLTIKGRVEATSGYIGGFTIEEGSLWSGFSYENPDIRISANGLYIKNIIEASLGRFWAAGLMSYNASGYSSSSGSYVEVGSTVIAKTQDKVALDQGLLKGLKSYFQEVVTLTSLTQDPVNPDYNDAELTFKIGLVPSVISSESDEDTPDPGLYLYDSSTSKWFPTAPLADAERKHAGLVLPGYTLIFHEAKINDQTVTNVLDVHLESSQDYDNTREDYTLGLHTQWNDIAKCVYLYGDINVHHTNTKSIQRSLNTFFTDYYNTVEAEDGLSSKVGVLEGIVNPDDLNKALVTKGDLDALKDDLEGKISAVNTENQRLKTALSSAQDELDAVRDERNTYKNEINAAWKYSAYQNDYYDITLTPKVDPVPEYDPDQYPDKY